MILTVDDFRPTTAMFQDLTLSTEQSGDGVLGEAIAGVQQLVELWCDDSFEQLDGEIVEDGSGSSRLVLSRRLQANSISAVDILSPGGVTSVVSTRYQTSASLSEDGLAFDPSGLDELRMLGGTWPTGLGTIRITGRFGWAVPPFPVKRAVALIVWDMCAGKNAGIIRAATWATQTASYSRANDVFMGIPEVEQLLSQYRYERDRVGAV